jgi:hypothetical protein
LNASVSDSVDWLSPQATRIGAKLFQNHKPPLHNAALIVELSANVIIQQRWNVR